MGSKTGAIELVNALIPNSAVFHQTRVLKYPEMLRDCRLTDRNHTSQLADSPRGLCQALEDGTPGGVA
jgi:hypothetical protein